MSVTDNNSISRRGALRGLAVATAAGVAAPTLATAAKANIGPGDSLRAVQARYALPGGRVVEGYFVSPRGKTDLDTVIVLHGANGLDADARALAVGYARAGKMAIVPDMPATYSGLKALAGRDAHIADLKALSTAFGRKMGANGKVEYVSA